MKEVYELDVYRLGEELSDVIWNAYDKWDYKAQHTLGLQVIRAVDSISANLAEGYGRFTQRTGRSSTSMRVVRSRKPNAGFARRSGEKS